MIRIFISQRNPTCVTGIPVNPGARLPMIGECVAVCEKRLNPFGRRKVLQGKVSDVTLENGLYYFNVEIGSE